MSTKKDTLLETLNLPEGIKDLCKQDMETLCQEIRDKLMEVKDECGGHLASNLGVVEITLALHAVFDSPKDKFVWDVSHQCYVHKMLTGRLDKIFTIKKYKGLSGFAKITESEHDCFGAGHASTALSAALGMAHARDIQGKDNNVVAIFGDASLSGGMSYEAINNIENMNKNFICILNDNDMSISRPVGSMATYMTKIRTTKMYDIAKEKFERIIEKIPKIGVPLKRRTEKLVERLRNTLIDTKAGVMFEEFGFKYLGPIDGHNVSLVMAALRYAKTYNGPIMLHLITTKGKGYTPAELDPIKYHGVSPKKAPSTTVTIKPKTYTQIFGEKIIDIAKKNDKVVVITPAMREGSGLQAYSEEFPDRYFDVGIAEEHAVTFAAGLAESGLTPVLAIYSTFLQRGFDQLIHDVCLQKLPVIFAIDRAGLVGADGPTHHGVFDYAFLLLIPNMTILAPKDGPELEDMLEWACDTRDTISIRYPRGSVPSHEPTAIPIERGKAELLAEHKTTDNDKQDILFLAAGSMVWPIADIGKRLSEKDISNTVINLRFIKPLDTELIKEHAKNSTHIVVVEEGNKIGGIHALVCQELNDMDIPLSHIHSMSIPDKFMDHGTVDELKEEIGLLSHQIEETIVSLITQNEQVPLYS